MNRIASIITTLALLSACSDAGDHPPLLPFDASAAAANSQKQSLTGCSEPFPKWHTMTNTITLANPEGVACPPYWYDGYDPTSWRAGKIVGGVDPEPPTTDLGPCFWNRPLKWNRGTCYFDMSFLCPNGVQYNARMTASSLNWSTATVVVDAIEPGCQRQARATFNVVTP